MWWKIDIDVFVEVGAVCTVRGSILWLWMENQFIDMKLLTQMIFHQLHPRFIINYTTI